MSLYISNGTMKIGAFTFPDRKKPMLGVDNGRGEITCYGSFRSKESANRFMIALAKCCGAKFEVDE